MKLTPYNKNSAGKPAPTSNMTRFRGERGPVRAKRVSKKPLSRPGEGLGRGVEG